jgi:Lanthionine synthetase C-like protein/Protein kinase domain
MGNKDLPPWGGGPDPISTVLDEHTSQPDFIRIGWTARLTAEGRWLSFQRADFELPDQGWKLHVSSITRSAPEVLRRVLPLLLSEKVSFKTASSWSALVYLNDGSGGVSQVGKFVTVYPDSDAQAVRLAAALDQATRGLPGPAVPSDRRLAPGSLVSYRYGGFGNLRLQMPWGEVVAAIRSPAGELEPDPRGTEFSAPSWVSDPFVGAGVADPPAESETMVAGRYLPMARLSRTARGSVFLAVDTLQPRRCILKESLRNVLVDRSGADAYERLRNEAEVLGRLSPDPRFPAILDLVETDEGLTLVMEDMVGETLENTVRELARDGRLPDGARMLRWAREIAEAVGVLHRNGLIFRDLKSSNVIVPPAGALRLFDFETVYDLRAGGPARGRGTRGYMSPQQARGEPPCELDDVHAFGGVLWFLATAVEPGRVPRYAERVGDLLALLNPAAPAGVGNLIPRCLAPDPEDRPPSMAAIVEELSKMESRPADPGAAFHPHEGGGEQRRSLREMAHRAGDALCGLARTVPGGEGVMWPSREGPGKGGFALDVNNGSAGVLLALSELARTTRDPGHLSALAQGAKWLCGEERPSGWRSPSLYVGEAGIGTALLRAGLVLCEDRFLEAAAQCSFRVAGTPLDSPDLFNGAAGRLRFHLAVWDGLAREDHLELARRTGEWLLQKAEAVTGGLCWRIPEGFGGLSETVQTGYAHGAAGIADVLLDLYEATSETRFREAAAGAASWLAGLAFPALADGKGADWPFDQKKSGRIGPFWCHGAAGIARFLFHAAALDLIPGAGELAHRAALTAARGSRWASPCQCHGLMGNAEVLVDAYQATRDRAYLDEAGPIAALLRMYAVEVADGLVWPFDAPETYTPDLMIGFSGVIPCLLRLAEPERRPHLLSRHGLVLRACDGSRS